jgi:hypothetical protein
MGPLYVHTSAEVHVPFGRVGRERIIASLWGGLFMAGLAALIVAGSRRLQHFDAALVGYTFAVLFATFAITYRYSMWLQRPPTRRYDRVQQGQEVVGNERRQDGQIRW